MDAAEEPGSTFLRADEVDEAGPEPVTVAEPESTLRPPLDTIEERRLGFAGPQQQDPQAPRPPTTRDPNIEHQPQQATDAVDADNPPDSISLLQLRNLVSTLPAHEPTPYAFKYEDASSFEEELDELFGYGWDEREFIIRLKDSFAKKWLKANRQEHATAYEEGGLDWSEATLPRKAAFLELLKTELVQGRQSDSVATLESLCYIALGCWFESSWPKDSSAASHEDSTRGSDEEKGLDTGIRNHVAEIKRNVMLIAELVDIDPIYSELQKAYTDDDPDEEIQTSTGRSRPASWTGYKAKLKWVTTVLLYLLVDTATRDDGSLKYQDLRSSVLELSPKLLAYLTDRLACLRWDETNALPPKKLLLLYWKTILVTFGGVAQIDHIKVSLNVKKPDTENDRGEPVITASPLDYHMFRNEITSKYPAFSPPPPLFPFEPECNSIVPLLQEDTNRGMFPGSSSTSAGPASINGTGSSIIHQPIHIATPAPSPPPSPAGPGGKGIKKQNYQTNQLFPFLYPPLEESSNDLGGKGNTELHDLFANRKWHGSDIPASILEAADIFAKRMRATRAMKQLWNERVRFMRYERGYGSINSTTADGDEQDEDVDDLTALSNDSRKRMQAVEDFYQTSLPKLPSAIIVLLKVLLQTVTTVYSQLNAPNGLANGVQSPDGQPPNKAEVNGDVRPNENKQSNTMLHDLDNMRQQEIMGKAVSGILLLLLKWLKLSHVLKAEYLSQLLLDSNYVQLLLKLLTTQELERVVTYRCERPRLNFLKLCQNYSRHGPKLDLDNEEFSDSDDPIAPVRQTDSSDEAPPGAAQPPPPEVDELGYSTSEAPVSPITTFSWRNFFSSINYLRVLQKIVKHRAHRQLLMIQFKYSNVLKKTLKVPQPDIRLYTLKIIKGQVPYCHRKWRSSNMRIITAIYLHCKPELRDEWLNAIDVDQEMGEALPVEQALRSLTYWHNLRMYPEAMGQDKAKAQGLMEEEQDFFLRELSKMDATLGPTGDADGGEGEEVAEAGNRFVEAPLHMEGW